MLLDTLTRTFARDLAGPGWDDPVALAEAAGLPPDPWHAKVLRSAARQQLLNACRQSGKTSVVSILALHRALERPASTVLAVSVSQRQAAELIRKVRDHLNVLRITDVGQESVLSVTLANGSRVLALPGSEASIRGYAADLVLIDEAARVPDATIDAIRPMVAVTNGTLIMLSTPWGMRGRFWQAWTEGSAAWERTRVPATECPRISAAWLEQERRSLPPLVYQSEYECEFTDVVTQVFATADVLRAVSPDVPLLFPGRLVAA